MTLKRVLEIQKKKRVGEVGMPQVYGSQQESRKASPGSSINSLIKNDYTAAKPPKKQPPILVAIIGTGEIFGDFECCNNQNVYQFSLVCHSITGELLSVDKSDFLKKVQSSS